jgi:hypothetical protein
METLYLLDYYYLLIVSWILLVVVYIYDEMDRMDMIIVYMMNGWNGQEIERSRLSFL